MICDIPRKADLNLACPWESDRGYVGSGLPRRTISGTSPSRVSAKFALMEFSEVRVWQVSYSRLYEP